MREKSMEDSYKGCFWSLIVMIVLSLVLLLTSCKHTEYVTVEKVRIDTTYITNHQRDSIWLHDSIYVENDDSIIRIEKWHTKYVEKQVHDTLYKAKVDSVPVPYPVPEYIEKNLTWWQQTRIHIANILLYLLGFGLLFMIVKKKFFNL